MKALEEDKDYIDLLKADSKVSSLLSDKEIDDCFTLDYYMKNVDYIYKRVGIK
jgi:adenylosuccinate lyase